MTSPLFSPNADTHEWFLDKEQRAQLDEAYVRAQATFAEDQDRALLDVDGAWGRVSPDLCEHRYARIAYIGLAISTAATLVFCASIVADKRRHEEAPPLPHVKKVPEKQPRLRMDQLGHPVLHRPGEDPLHVLAPVGNDE